VAGPQAAREVIRVFRSSPAVNIVPCATSPARAARVAWRSKKAADTTPAAFRGKLFRDPNGHPLPRMLRQPRPAVRHCGVKIAVSQSGTLYP
jgi:hypothetical protein